MGRSYVKCCRSGWGFTLVELLVVIAIIGVLIGLLLPAINAARESGQRIACANSFKQTGLAMIAFTETFRRFPPPYEDSPKAKRSMFIDILPFCEFSNVYKLYNFRYDWNDPKNKAAIDNNIPMLVCPSAPAKRDYVSDYGPCTSISSNVYSALISAGKITKRKDWNGLMAPPTKGPNTPQMVTDGLSHTFMLFEDAGRPMIYDDHRVVQSGTASGARWADRENEYAINQITCGDNDQVMNCTSSNETFSFHPGGCNFLYGDGSVRFHSERISIEVYVSLFTRAAGDSLGNLDSSF
jgi:prepilin-type N-terminal cleavage/methylation domain-containing protein/prepilin-type processing-associated H-X9-DG protein